MNEINIPYAMKSLDTRPKVDFVCFFVTNFLFLNTLNTFRRKFSKSPKQKNRLLFVKLFASRMGILGNRCFVIIRIVVD